MRVDPRDMPPDPFAEDGVDRMALEHAEELARHPADSASAEWDRFDGPTTDEFDDAKREITELGEGTGDGAELSFALWKAGMAAVAVVVIIAMLVLFVW